MSVRLILPYPPSANKLWRPSRGQLVSTEAALVYHKEVRYACRQQGVEPVEGDVVLTLHVYRPRRLGDLSNRIKILEDALNGWAWIDDSQVVEIHAYRHDDPANPRVEVEIEAVPPVLGE